MVHLDHIWKITMSNRPYRPTDTGTQLALRGNLLTAPIRRDVADLNRLFLGGHVPAPKASNA